MDFRGFFKVSQKHHNFVISDVFAKLQVTLNPYLVSCIQNVSNPLNFVVASSFRTFGIGLQSNG